MATSIAIFFSPDGQPMPEIVASWLSGQGLRVETLREADDLMAVSLRGRPRIVVADARRCPERSLVACRRMKADSYTAVVPSLLLSAPDDAAFAAAFEAGADEVVREPVPAAEVRTRLDAMLRRSDRDLVVHPSTRLPGAIEIELEVQRRLAAGAAFAMCYADLDHFKEFNDRYSYNDGDRVIRILAKILHDVVKGICAEDGFVGHIGGDDFIFVIPADDVQVVCEEIILVFDTLVPFQYGEQDRRSGYFFGKDRRGQLHRVPLMTVSIGVVTNERRVFTHAAQVSELATEMKSYAKTLPGSVYSIDRRSTATDAERQDRVSGGFPAWDASALAGEGK
ncbi:MAG TPA: GGDEF domain-containing protein [Tepidiformaceae bacterium]|nr:GGDEF domain-containing protein [Tepidiformaceae bacterium]